jgi:transcriptional regulator with XRE-family HTH domain
MNEEIIKEARIQFGLLFKEWRKKKSLSQSQVAEFCGVTFQTINKVEQGKFPYSVDLLVKLSVVLEFTINFEMKEIGDDSRFILQQSQRQGFWTCTDKENQIVCTFENGKFNDTQSFSVLNDTKFSAGKVATIMRELGDWLAQNHSHIV